jgi:hypothetical protein
VGENLGVVLIVEVVLSSITVAEGWGVTVDGPAPLDAPLKIKKPRISPAATPPITPPIMRTRFPRKFFLLVSRHPEHEEEPHTGHNGAKGSSYAKGSLMPSV